MASTASKPSAGGSVAPDTDEVRRLAVEAGKYVGLDPGDALAIEELRLQAEANGYDDPAEIDRLLADAGLRGRESVTIPEQGELFGDLWSPHSSTSDPEGKSETQNVGSQDGDGSHDRAGVPHDDAPPVGLDRLSRFRDWCQLKVDNDSTDHAYARRTANRRYARAKDVDREFVERYDTFTTVHVVFCVDRAEGESTVEHASRFYPRSVTRKRRGILQKLDVFEDYAWVSVLAPKYPESHELKVDKSQSTTARSTTTESDTTTKSGGITHGHGFGWLPGQFSESLEDELKDNFDRVTGDDVDLDVSVETHESVEVTTPGSVSVRGSGLDAERGATTALPHELAANLPLLDTRLDARGLPEYAERWCSAMRLGTDNSIETSGIQCFRPLGRFNELADARKWRRDLVHGARHGARIRAEVGDRREVLQQR